MLKEFFMPDPTYKQMTANYNKRDMFVAVCVYIFIILLYLGAGYLHFTVGLRSTSVYTNILLSLVVVAVILFRKQKLNTAGFTINHFKKAFIVGLVFGIIFSIPGFFSAIKAGLPLNSLGVTIWNIFFTIIIVLPEEIIFRGYIQTRLYGVIKSDLLAMSIGSIMFSLAHIPYNLFDGSSGYVLGFFMYNSLWLLQVLVMHFIFSFLFRKYNSIVTSTVCHFIINLSTALFFGMLLQ